MNGWVARVIGPNCCPPCSTPIGSLPCLMCRNVLRIIARIGAFVVIW